MSQDSFAKFEEARGEDVHAGAIKFSTDYVSKLTLFEAVTKWIEEDKNVLKAVIRGGGGDQIALDFIYDASSIKEDSKKGGRLLDAVLKPVFERLLGADYMRGWDFSGHAVVVK
jgi:hypothetical protein